VPLPDKAKKLILLLLDGAASTGEQDTATRKLIACLRANFKDGYALLAEWGHSPSSTSPPPKPSAPKTGSSTSVSGAFKLPFGQYKGCELWEVPIDYLFYLLDWPELWPNTRKAIERYLEDE
jgi:hypothetical protein